MKKIVPVLIALFVVSCVTNNAKNVVDSIPENKSAANSYIQSLSSCPKKVQRGFFLDGGTIGVRVHYDSSEIKYFGMENNQPFESYSSSKKLTDDELTKIAVGRQVKVFLGVHPTARTFSQILPFRGEEERELATTIQRWITCDSLDKKSKEQVNMFLDDILSDRIREVKHLFDIPDRKLAEWREANSRQGVFGNDIKNDYQIINGVNISTTQLVEISPCSDTYECEMSWYRYEVRVAYASNTHAKGDVINLARKEKRPTPTLTSNVGVYVVSEIPSIELQESLNAKYYIHEVSYPKKVLCFNHLLSELGLPEWDRISYRLYGDWEKQCIPAE